MIRECNDEVRFGTTGSSLLSGEVTLLRLCGRDSPERGREVKEGAIASTGLQAVCLV